VVDVNEFEAEIGKRPLRVSQREGRSVDGAVPNDKSRR